MNNLLKLVITFGFTSAFSAFAVEEQCGTFHWSQAESPKTPLIHYKTLVMDNGETFDLKAPFVAVTEAATDVVTNLQGGENVCFKANVYQGSSNKTFYVFSVTKK